MSYRLERNYDNINKWAFEQVGKYGIPPLWPEIPGYCRETKNFIGFNYAKTYKGQPENTGIHFFIDDYQFTRLWTNPEAYLDTLKQYRLVFTPDFSMYRDWPVAMQLWNLYRKQWLGAFWQANGISVVPTVTWSDEQSFEWCFDGIPRNAVVAVSSVGTQVEKKAKELFDKGYNEMLQRLQPELIYFYGNIPEGIATDNIINIAPLYKQVRERCKDKRS